MNLVETIEEMIGIISSACEIRLNIRKPQSIFTNNNFLYTTKNFIKLLDNMGINMFPIHLESMEKELYLYYNNDRWYRFDKGHYNINLTIDDTYYVCIIKDFNHNIITLDCRDYSTDSILTKKFQVRDFIDRLSNIESYHEGILDILCRSETTQI